MAQQVILTTQLVPKFHTSERCNNYTVLQSIPCYPECKIVGQILLDHPLSYALNTTADVHVVYLQQFWRTVSKIHATNDVKEYELMFMKGKKRKQSAEESSSPRQSYKITIKKKKPSTTLIIPPSDDRERGEIPEATLLSLTLYKTALAAEAQENIAKVDDFGTRLEPGSHKENPEKVDDDDIEIGKEKKDDVEIEKEKKDEEIEKERNNDNVEETNKVVKDKYIIDDVTGSTEIRKEQKQTPISSPTRSPMNVSSSDKTVFE
nr:hypothetical protein [Tanacetum cinerariifolium]